jgi:hypothetical protein
MEKVENQNKKPHTMHSVLDIEVSCVKNYFTKTNPQPVNLLTWLGSKKYAAQVAALRAQPDKAMRDKLKAQLPAITPSGTFSEANEKGLLAHSGFIQFDIDLKDNLHIPNYHAIKHEIARIKNVAYVGRSAGGQGYWGLVRIAYPERHLQHWHYMHQLFSRMQLRIDPAPKNVASLRGYSYDPDGIYNHNAVRLFHYLTDAAPPVHTARPHDANHALVQYCLERIDAQEIDITAGYNTWIAIGCALAGTFGEEGRAYYHRFSHHHPQYDPAETNHKYDECKKITKSTNLGIIVNKCKEARMDMRFGARRAF